MEREKQTLGFLLSRASNSMAAYLNSMLKKEGIDLPYSQYIVLRLLYFNDGLSQLEIAKHLSKDAAAIKRTVDNLEQKGFVERIQIRTLKNSICVTDKGRELMPQVINIVDSIGKQALSGVGKEQQAVFEAILKIIHLNLKK